MVHGKGGIVIKCSPALAWDFIVNPDNWGSLPLLKHAHVTSPGGKITAGRDVYMRVVTSGVSHNIRIQFTDFRRPKRMAWSGTVRYFMVGGLWPLMLLNGTLGFEKVRGGVHVSMEMSIYPNGNPINRAAFYWMTRILNLGHVFNDTMDMILLSFQSKLED